MTDVGCAGLARAPRPALIRALAIALVAATLPVCADAAKVDVIVLQNGTRVVGEVESMSKGRLEV